jgi:hypothetical protein
MRIACLSMVIFLALSSQGCSHSTECGAAPNILCAPFKKLSASLTEQEKADAISLITNPANQRLIRDKAVGRAQAILNLGRNDEVMTYFGSQRIEGDGRVYQAVLCGYAQWIRDGSTNMNEILKAGLGRCWTTPEAVLVPIVVN